MKQVREHLATYGDHQLSDAQLVAVLLGTRGERQPLDVAHRVLAGVGGLAKLSQASVHELAALRGVGSAAAARLVAGLHLGRRALRARATAGGLHSAADVHARLAPALGSLQQEVFMVLALDARNQVRAEVEVARGSLTGVAVHPRDVFQFLLREHAAAAIVAHNHPSGDPQPSSEDLTLTSRLRTVAELVGIPLLDHVIICADSFCSIAEREWA